MSTPLSGIAYIRRGFQLIRQPGVRRYAVLPVLVSLIVYSFAMYWIVTGFAGWLNDFSLLQRWQDNAVIGAVTSVLTFIVGAAFLIMALYTFSIVANLIGSPFNSLLAERIELKLRGGSNHNVPFSMQALLASLPRTLFSEIRKLLYLALWMIPISILFLVPLIQIAAPFLLLLFGAWMYAIEYLDYPMGNHNRYFSDVRKHARRHRWRALGFGAGVSVMTVIPIINLLAMPIAVAGATALWFDTQDQEQNA